MPGAMYWNSISHAIEVSIDDLKTYGQRVDTGHWQGVPTEGKPDLITKEIMNLTFETQIPPTKDAAVDAIRPNMTWAEDHFQERVSRVPSNPGVEYMNWPWWHGQKDQTQEQGPKGFRFTHTYQERFWPKHAGHLHQLEAREGIRYQYGDLDDVVNLLRREPHTRQAYFPIFFAEDTGAVHGGRIPCSLGYYFLLRGDLLNCWYDIRSCDAVRHFRDDLYMACRLCHWVLEELREHELRSDDPQLWFDVNPGRLCFSAYSFHVHMGDFHLL